jgi:putative addiction module CopG family antidote
MLVKAALVTKIGDLIRDLGLNQHQAARLLGLTSPGLRTAERTLLRDFGAAPPSLPHPPWQRRPDSGEARDETPQRTPHCLVCMKMRRVRCLLRDGSARPGCGLFGGYSYSTLRIWIRNRSMKIDLSAETERLIAEEVDSGRYQSAKEVVRKGLELLKERDEHVAAAAPAENDFLSAFHQVAATVPERSGRSCPPSFPKTSITTCMERRSQD